MHTQVLRILILVHTSLNFGGVRWTRSPIPTYSERLFRFDRIEHLDRGLSEKAIVEPAENEGVSWDNDAFAYVVAESAGYPSFWQQFGQSAWNEAESSPIRLTDARVGTSEGRRILDAGFFRSRWDRATTAEQKHLRAMSEDGDRGTLVRDLATRLGRNVQGIGPSRANLIFTSLGAGRPRCAPHSQYDVATNSGCFPTR
ncbi:unannotated protein [freshwater metagenome]|uniref:Unannotated protein n=1 Tax=freshwater metagenome TaxID=449393 RepID=A0A6J7KS84_9ZZZZ